MGPRTALPAPLAFALSAMLLLLLPACPDPAPATQVVAVFDADRVVQRVARDIEIVGYGGSRGSGIPRENVQTLRFNIADIGGWPITHTLAPLGGDATRLYQVEGRLLDQNGVPIAHVRSTSGYLDERSLELRLRFYAHCLYVDPCAEEAESCNANGDCVLAVTAPEALPEVADGGAGMPPDGGEPACRTDLDCDDLIGCTVDTCLDGACVNREDHTRCDADGACDGMAGCQYGDTCDETTCQPEGCDETVACVDGLCVRSSKCSPAQECCGTECVTCNDGSLCTHHECNPAASACVVSDREGTCTDGIYCNGLEACAGGACAPGAPPCGGDLVCDEDSAACIGCLDGGDCAPTVDHPPSGPCEPVTADPCSTEGEQIFHRVTTACEAGSCIETAMPVGMSCVVPGVDGASCGTGDVSWGPCVPDRSDGCTESGTRTGRTVIDVCRSGACTAEGSGGSRTEGCTYTPPPSCAPMDAGIVDSGIVDSGVADTSTPVDSGIEMDSGIEIDSGIEMDSGTEIDSGFEMDSGFEIDSSPDEDSGIEMDSSTGSDSSGPVMDSSVGADAA